MYICTPNPNSTPTQAPGATVATAMSLAAIPPERKTPDVLESVFIYAAVWAFGGGMGVDKQVGGRRRRDEEVLHGPRDA